MNGERDFVGIISIDSGNIINKHYIMHIFELILIWEILIKQIKKYHSFSVDKL